MLRDRMLREMIAAPKVAARNTFAGNLLTQSSE
jgi:hypothetical protein